MLHYKCEIVDDHLLLNLRLGHLHHHHESHQVEQHRWEEPANSFTVALLSWKTKIFGLRWKTRSWRSRFWDGMLMLMFWDVDPNISAFQVSSSFFSKLLSTCPRHAPASSSPSHQDLGTFHKKHCFKIINSIIIIESMPTIIIIGTSS